ncbi:septal ring lytic transglycosylase RlpA family protein [Nitrosomonas sp. Nm33]|uniref:septal ring lytic transglycosylase RlpA family protein n=1 Tax=Nitrosomonas sp. Nm33 TaxID=133724 RepID=UPI00089AECF9|nr:septal ring lytic transglycosylase RlpA family protein [Nitrosomonas sp. Nm33]SDY39658.1 rare lipoprotein A [Nitrosomonas sp. Nm33]
MMTSTLHSFSHRWIACSIPLIFIIILIILAGCSNLSQYAGSREKGSATSSTFSARIKGGGYYLDDGPPDNPPANLDSIPDAIPRIEPLRPANMRPYDALGQTFTPMTSLTPYTAQGIASWYGRRYHGKQTASGEVYDMFAMTAAHPTLPIPSYVRVTNLKNGKSIVVRINDRGPFLANRVVDLSYTAAYKLDVLTKGSAPVKVEAIIPGVASSPQAEKIVSTQPPSTQNTKIYLQLAAFGSASNAHNFLSQIRSELPSITHQTGITNEDGLYKIRTGPYPSEISARKSANEITQRIAVKPILTIANR